MALPIDQAWLPAFTTVAQGVLCAHEIRTQRVFVDQVQGQILFAEIQSGTTGPDQGNNLVFDNHQFQLARQPRLHVSHIMDHVAAGQRGSVQSHRGFENSLLIQQLRIAGAAGGKDRQLVIMIDANAAYST